MFPRLSLLRHADYCIMPDKTRINMLVARISWRGGTYFENLHPAQTQLGGLGRAASSPSGVWGGAPTDNDFGAFYTKAKHLVPYKSHFRNNLWLFRTWFFHANFTCNIIYYRLLLFNTYKHFTDLMETFTHHLASCLEMASDKFQPLEAL